MIRRLFFGLPLLVLAALAAGCNREQAGTPAVAPADAAAGGAAATADAPADPGGAGSSNADKGLGKRGAGKTRASEAARNTVD